MLDIIVFESIITVILIICGLCFWKCFDVPEKTFSAILLILMLVLITKNSVDYFADPHCGERPTMEDVLNGDATIVNDTTIRQNVYWNDELK